MRVQSAATAASASASSVAGRPSRRRFIGRLRRSAEKPECISADSERASARAAGSRGQIARSGCVSARCSTTASESQTTKAPSCSTGTFPAGLWRRISACAWGASSGITISSKGIAKARISSHGRIDQDE